jgi:hypothetical protein
MENAGHVDVLAWRDTASLTFKNVETWCQTGQKETAPE